MLRIPAVKRSITDQWRRQVSAELKHRKMSQAQLAEALGATGTGVSLVLRGRLESSKLVEPISDLLDIELPPLDLLEPEAMELLEIFQELGPEEREILRQSAMLYLKKSK